MPLITRVISFLTFMLPSVSHADIWSFETPSENIQCLVGEETDYSDLICTIIVRNSSYAMPKPPSCKADWGHTFTMRDNGVAEIICILTNTNKDTIQRLDYGRTEKFGGFKCHSSKRGLRCINRDGNGFFLSKSKQSIINPNVTNNDLSIDRKPGQKFATKGSSLPKNQTVNSVNINSTSIETTQPAEATNIENSVTTAQTQVESTSTHNNSVMDRWILRNNNLNSGRNAICILEMEPHKYRGQSGKIQQISSNCGLSNIAGFKIGKNHGLKLFDSAGNSITSGMEYSLGERSAVGYVTDDHPRQPGDQLNLDLERNGSSNEAEKKHQIVDNHQVLATEKWYISTSRRLRTDKNTCIIEMPVSLVSGQSGKVRQHTTSCGLDNISEFRTSKEDKEKVAFYDKDGELVIHAGYKHRNNKVTGTGFIMGETDKRGTRLFFGNQ